MAATDDLKPVAAATAFMAASAPAMGPSTSASPVIEPMDKAAWAGSFTLAFPLIVDGEPLITVTLRRITAGEVASLVMADDAETSLNLRARALVAGLHPAVFSALAGEDGVRLAAAIRPFLPADLVVAEDAMSDLLAADVGDGE